MCATIASLNVSRRKWSSWHVNRTTRRVEWIDDQIGMVLDALRQSPFADNTVIVYTTDHGENLGEHGLWWKNCLYDSGCECP